MDHEGGRVQRFRSGFSVLPPLRRIGKEYDLDAKAGVNLARHMGWLMAAELRACGVDLSFAPCVDLDYGVSEVIGDRAFHAKADCSVAARVRLHAWACVMRAWRRPPNIIQGTARSLRTRTLPRPSIGAPMSISTTT